MKDAEDEAFDELAKRQGHWGGGYQAKRAMAADKLQEPEREALKLALEALDIAQGMLADLRSQHQPKMLNAYTTIKEALAQPAHEPVTILPDGSAFGVMSFPLPDDHWLYAPNEYRDGEYEPIDLPKPILTHALSESVVAAVRYAVRGATMRGQETDFDPDALVQNAVYALCGPYTTTAAPSWVGLTDEELKKIWYDIKHLIGWYSFQESARATEAKLKERNS